jgi:hypothetical protein
MDQQNRSPGTGLGFVHPDALLATPCARKPGELFTSEVNGQFYSRMWQLAWTDSFEPHSEVAARGTGQ